MPRCEDVAGDEIDERRREDAELSWLDAEENEAHAPDSVCPLCEAPIAPVQDARLLADGRWAHQVCPARGAPDASEQRQEPEAG